MARKFTLSITCDNAAFDDDDGRAEIARILRDIARRVELGEADNGLHQNARDMNGNPVGTFVLKDSAD